MADCAAVGCQRQTYKLLQLNFSALSIRVPLCDEHMDAYAGSIDPAAVYSVDREDHRGARDGEARDGEARDG